MAGEKTSTTQKHPQARHFWSILIIIFNVLSLSRSHDYKEALTKSILYFESQRSGRLPYNQRVTWRYHSGLSDGLEQGVSPINPYLKNSDIMIRNVAIIVDLVGGYYDAGDNVKFGLPMAFTITMLSWGVIDYANEIAAAGEFGHALEAIKWGTDYFIKAHTHPNVLWVQVGDGDTDHYCWQRPEDMTTSRQAHKIDEKNPGTEVAAETAAALAAASILFRKSNPHYSHLLLQHAQQLFEFGDKYRGKYDESVRVAKRYYQSVSGYKDELLWGAMWLYKATDRVEYLNYVVENAQSFGGSTWAIAEFSWDIKYAGLQILASMLMVEEKPMQHENTLDQYRSNAEHYLCACLNKTKSSNVHRTPGGLLYTRKWNNLQYVTTASFLLTIYSDHLKSINQTLKCHQGEVGPQEILAFARSQVDYILGSNPMAMSYLVGYGSKSPLRVHHRGASIVSYRKEKGFIGCTQGYDSWHGRKDPNPNVVYGAVVGGPNLLDGFSDDRENYLQTEACIYNTAPLVGVLAKLNSLDSGYGVDKPLLISSIQDKEIPNELMVGGKGDMINRYYGDTCTEMEDEYGKLPVNRALDERIIRPTSYEGSPWAIKIGLHKSSLKP
ncbi:Glycoside hydrolase family 9, partial [Dillenia turbinata]